MSQILVAGVPLFPSPVVQLDSVGEPPDPMRDLSSRFSNLALYHTTKAIVSRQLDRVPALKLRVGKILELLQERMSCFNECLMYFCLSRSLMLCKLPNGIFGIDVHCGDSLFLIFGLTVADGREEACAH